MDNTKELDFWEDELDSEIEINPEKFQDVVTWSTDWTTETIVNLVQKEKIDLTPKMQRREVWDDVKKSKLIESLILNIPIPQIILAEKKEKKGYYMVIDGKQRLLSILQFFSDSTDNDFPMLTIKKLDVLKQLNGKTRVQLQKENNEQIIRLLDILDNQTIRTIVIKNWEDEDLLFAIFNRLNTGTTPLSPQELRMTLYPGPFMDYVLRNSKHDEILNLLNLSSPDKRMQDVELLIRYFGFVLYLDQYKGNLKKFFDQTTLNLNRSWESMKDDVEKYFDKLIKISRLIKEIFNKNSFKRFNYTDNKYNRQLNKAIIDLLTYFLARDQVYNEIEKLSDKGRFEDFYKNLFADKKFADDLSSHTTDVPKITYRFNYFAKEFNKYFEIEHSINPLPFPEDDFNEQ